MAENERQRRYKLAYVDSQLIWDMLGVLASAETVRLPVFSNMPEDAEVTSVQYDYSRLAFAFRIYHESFDVVEIGKMIPEVKEKVEFEYRVFDLAAARRAEKKEG